MNLNNLSGDELHSALLKNQNELIAAKKMQLKFTDNLQFEPEVTKVTPTKGQIEVEKKSDTGTTDPQVDSGVLHVKVVANTAWWMDSYGDVITADAYTQSIKDNPDIPHLLDHIHSAVGHIGDTQKLYTSEIQLRDLGVNQPGVTTALIMESLVRKDYNEKAYQFYLNGKIDQHSIGLTYGDIQLAINKPGEKDYEANYQVWKDNIDNIINKDKALAKGYFWLIPSLSVKENSAVLFGANSLTPTLEIGKSESTIDTKTELTDESKSNSNPSTINPKGNNMDLQEALTQLATKDSEIATLKANQSLEVAKAKMAETSRIKGILEAQKTFGQTLDLSLKFIEANATVDMAVMSFEAVKAAQQSATHVDTTGTAATSTLTNVTNTTVPFSKSIDDALDLIEKTSSSNLFKGMM